MAAITLLGTATWTATSGTKTVTATPAVGDLIVIVTAHTGNTSSSTPTDDNSSGTYTRITSAVKASSADTLGIHIRTALIGAASSTVFTHAPGTSSGGGLAVFKVTGMTRTGAAAARQSAVQSNQGAGGTPTPVLGSAALTANALIAALFNATNPAGMTPRASPAWTERNDSGYNTPASGLETMTIDSGETGTSIAWGGTSASAFCDLVLELDTSQIYDVTRGESVAIADAQSASLDAQGQRDESFALSDAQTATAVFSAASNESVSLSDSQSATLLADAQRAESVGLADAQSATASFSASASESLDLADTQTATVVSGANSQTDESVSLSDAQSATSVLSAARDEAFSLTDAQTATGVAYGGRDEAFSLSDAYQAAVLFSGTVAEQLFLADAQEGVVVPLVSLGEVLPLTSRLTLRVSLLSRLEVQLAEDSLRTATLALTSRLRTQVPLASPLRTRLSVVSRIELEEV